MTNKNSKKISSKQILRLFKEIRNYGFIHEKKFFYTGIFTPTSLSRFVNQPIETIKKIWTTKLKKNTSFKAAKNLSENEMQEIILELEMEFFFLKKWTFLDCLQHYFFAGKTLNYSRKPIVVTIMGHVNHGKTTLLDAIRNSRLTAREAGQITQKIGGYQIIYKNEKITFLDTPGHEFFSAIRARGAAVTNLVVLVVSGTEGIKEQTNEAIDHILNAKLPTIVFINKKDQSNFKPDRIINDLATRQLVSTEYGGNTIFLSGSALKKTGVQELLNKIKEISKTLPLKTFWNQPAQGIILDCFLERSGPVVSVLIEKGIAKLRDFIVVNKTTGRIKAMINDQEKSVKTAQPGDCVLISGLNETVSAGDRFYVFPEEKIATLLTTESFLEVPTVIDKPKLSATEIFSQMLKKKAKPEVNLIVKFDSKGTEDAFCSQIKNLPETPQKLNFIRIATGAINQNDLNLAKNTNAQLLIFNLNLNRNILDQIKTLAIKWEQFNVIYKLWERLEILGQNPTQKSEIISITGSAKLIKVFEHSKFGKIAGCLVLKGKITKNDNFVRVIRDDKIIAKKLKIRSLKHEKNDITQMSVNQECGIIFDRFSDFKLDDRLEQYIIEVNKHE